MAFHTAINTTLDRLGGFALRFERHATVRAITEGLVNLIPLVLIGTICLAVSNLPIPALHDFLNGITVGHWSLIASIISFSTEDIIGLAALLSVSYVLAVRSTFMQGREITPFIPMFTAFACYVVLVVWDPASYAATPAGQEPVVLFTNPGRNGVFDALFVALVSVNLFILFARIWQRLPWGHWQVLGSHQQIRLAIRTVFPVVCTLISFIALRFLGEWLFSTTHIEALISGVILEIVSEGSLQSVIISVLLMQLLWFFGVHGSNTIQSYMEQAGATMEQAGAASASGALDAIDPATMFTDPDFYSVFVDMGGSGTTVGLLIVLLVVGSASRGKRLGRISIFPVVFNINETLVFGMPVVFNPFFFIPFILAPVLSAAVAYGAFSLELVPPMTNYVEWTTPLLFSGYLSTGSPAGSLLQLVCVALAIAVYLPFVLFAKSSIERYQFNQFDCFKKEAAAAANNEHVSLMTRRDEIGEMARDFAAEANELFEEERIPFYMMYQPKTNRLGEVVGAEALLRWTHPRFGPVPPDVLIEITDEAGLSVPMGRWITTQALEEHARWQGHTQDPLHISINLNPYHLFADKAFPEFLAEEMQRIGTDPGTVELEITEHAAVHASPAMLEIFRSLRSLGVELSIDDMGMGYSSLTYISDFGVSVVKIDVSLIDKVVCDIQQQEIVRSVVELARQIDLAVIVEGVETREQVDALVSLGCRYFQGYYFSRPLTPRDFLSYAAEHGTARMEREGL
ncbi:MAG: EAL domain-containing protein [Coriobacteriales bacterium]|jgi:lactose/cellobiose-specific phosphotransferase system IIC component|nr:EAL domain-containing protein [Coriobacteriales bacterium]